MNLVMSSRDKTQALMFVYQELYLSSPLQKGLRVFPMCNLQSQKYCLFISKTHLVLTSRAKHDPNNCKAIKNHVAYFK